MFSKLNFQKILFLGFLLTFFLQNIAKGLEIQKGGVLIFGRGGDSVSLDPSSVTDGESMSVTKNIFDNLVTLKTGTTDVIPDLSSRYSVSQDGKTYTFFLRKGVKFHDGTDFDANAVKFSFERQKDPSHPAYKYAGPYVYFRTLGLVELISDINVKDPYTIEFKLKRSHAPFLATLASPALSIVSPTAVMKYKNRFRVHPVGSGPFIFKRWDRNQKIVLTANTSYWNEPPYLKKVIFRSIPDNETRLMEFMAGNIHIMKDPSPDDVGVIKDRMGKAAQIMSKEGFNIGYLAMNMDKPPLDKLKVRKAIAHAVNKKGIIEAIYAGQAQAAVNPIPPNLWGHNDSIVDWEYSIEKAKKLMKEAGFENGFDITLWAMPVPRPYMPDGRKVAEAIQGDLKHIKINAKIVSYDWGTYLTKSQQGEHDLILLGWTGDIGDPDNFLYSLLDKDSAEVPAQNLSFYRSNELHELLAQAKTVSDTKKRVDLYKRSQDIIHQDVPMLPIAHSVVNYPIRKNVMNYVIDPTGRQNMHKVWIKR